MLRKPPSELQRPSEGLRGSASSRSEPADLRYNDAHIAGWRPPAQVTHCEVVVAGYPKAIMDDLNKAGLKNFIHVRSNVLESLQDIQKKLGI